MLLLAVDTSGRNGSLALVRADESRFDVLELIPLAARMYSAQIIPELQNALSHQNLNMAEIDAYAVASGPGSFTGLRVGLSTVKAFSEVLHRPIAAVSVLEAAARVAARTGEVTVALDAGRKQVFVGEYQFDDDFKVISARESLVGLDAFFHSLRGSNTRVFAPDQAIREAAATHGLTFAEIALPEADIFARIGYQKLVAGHTTPAEVLEANYIRASDAELFSLPKLIP